MSPPDLHRFFSPVGFPIHLRSSFQSEPEALVAEADGNRTRLPALAGTPVLKFGDGRVVGCDLVLSGAFQSRSCRTFMLSGAVR